MHLSSRPRRARLFLEVAAGTETIYEELAADPETIVQAIAAAMEADGRMSPEAAERLPWKVN